MDETQPPIRSRKMQVVKRVFLYILFIIVVIVTYNGGYRTGLKAGRTRPEPPQGSGRVLNTATSTPLWLTRDVDFGIYWDVWTWIQSHYIDHPVDEPKLFYGSLAGMVASLGDPYSLFLEPKNAEEFSSELQGHFEGIGAEIGIRDNRLTVISPLPESPAEQAGLKPEDWILKIDGHDTAGIDLNDAVQKIRGQKGTKVALTVMREGFDAPREFAIVRDQIKIVSVQAEMKEGSIAYIRITNFNADTGERFSRAVDDMLKKKPRGVIIDLRNDPGGYLDTAVEIASYWVTEARPVVLERKADKSTNEYRALRNQALSPYPTVILVNKGSASASEIVAGALQDYGFAQLVGQTTFGKGSIQDLKEFSDGSAVKLTIARWLTPKERQIDRQGIKPDAEIEIKDEDAKSGKDPQLEKALELLSKTQKPND